MSTTSKNTTYPQAWSAYNAAQTFEQENVARMLSELCESIKSPIQQRGRPRIPLADAMFCAVMKVYSGTSGRRAMTDMREYEAKRFIDRAPHYNSIFTVLEDPSITQILKALIETTARPMREIESDFAVDSTGFSTRTYERWFDQKYGRIRSQNQWVKAHVMVGVRTKIVTSVEVTPANVNDTTQFVALLRATARNFDIEEVSADRAYVSLTNVSAVHDVGAYPLIPFRSRMTGFHITGSSLWYRLFQFFKHNTDEFYQHYHKRSNVETAFSMMKAKFGAFVRSKTRTAQVNEVLCKVLCHNMCVVLQAAYEGGLTEMVDAA